jgi:hypothetical protein
MTAPSLKLLLAVSGIFADLVSGLAARPVLVETISRQLRATGLEITPLARN